MPRSVRAAIASIAFQQHGLITREQLIGCGLCPSAIDKRIRAGTLERTQPSVYRIAGAPSSWEQLLLGALLAAREPSFVSHLAAGVVWRFEEVVAYEPHILLPHERRVDLVGVVIHRTRKLSDDEVTIRHGLRLTSPARTLVDLAGMLGRYPLERVLDDALRRQIVTLDHVRASLDARGPNGVRGWAVLNRFVDERYGTRPTGSGKETTFRRGLVRRGLPLPVAQHTITDAHGRFIARVDFAYPELRIAIEVDGSGHATLSQRRTDSTRQNRLVLAGWRPLRFPENDRAGQREAFDTIQAAFSAFGEPERKNPPLELPKRRKTGRARS